MFRQLHTRVPRGDSSESQGWHGDNSKGDNSKVRSGDPNYMNQSPHPSLAGLPARIFKVSLQLEDCFLEKAFVANRIFYCTESHLRGYIVEFVQLHPTSASIQPRRAEPHDPSEDVPTDARAWSPTGARNEWRPELSSKEIHAPNRRIYNFFDARERQEGNEAKGAPKTLNAVFSLSAHADSAVCFQWKSAPR